MATYRHLNGQQLRMFIPAHELMTYEPSDVNVDDPLDVGYSETPIVLESKRSDNNVSRGGRPSLLQSVAAHGVQNPVPVTERGKYTRGSIWDGHHRIAAAYDTNPNMEVPVRYS